MELLTLLKATSDDTLMNFLIPIMDVGKSDFFLILFSFRVTGYSSFMID